MIAKVMLGPARPEKAKLVRARRRMTHLQREQKLVRQSKKLVGRKKKPAKMKELTKRKKQLVQRMKMMARRKKAVNRPSLEKQSRLKIRCQCGSNASLSCLAIWSSQLLTRMQ